MIVEANISAAIVKLIKDNKDTESAIQFFADGLAKIIADAIKSGTVTINAGIPVSTSGTPAAQTGATVATGTGTIK